VVFKAPQKSGFALAGVLLGAKTNSITGALTVAGQWRNFTAFPSILTISVVDYAAPLWSRNDDAMNAISMVSTFINGSGREVKMHRAKGASALRVAVHPNSRPGIGDARLRLPRDKRLRIKRCPLSDQ
jgi:hypothetical protein